MVNPIPLLRASAVSPFVTFLKTIGTPTERLLQQARLPVWALDDPHAHLPRHQVFAFVNSAIRQEGIDNIGWLVGQRYSYKALGALGRAISQGITLRDAIAELIRLGNLFNSAERFWLGVRGDRAWLGQEFSNLDEPIPDYASQFTCLLLLEVIQTAAGSHWYPQEIYLQSPQTENLGNCPLAQTRIDTTKGVTAIVFPRAFLSLPFHKATASDRAQDYQVLQASAPAIDFVGSLQQAIAPFLQENYPSIELAAEISQMSVRTLQRRLADDNLSYSQLIARLRYQKAIELLKSSDLKMIDIAAELGYLDAAHFTRAFKRWAGISPKNFRRDRQTSQIS